MPPQENMPLAEENKNKIWHVALPVGNFTLVMGCDTPKGMPEAKKGSNKNSLKKAYHGLRPWLYGLLLQHANCWNELALSRKTDVIRSLKLRPS
jgi:hypothetical protein